MDGLYHEWETLSIHVLVSWSEMGNSDHEFLAFGRFFVYNMGDFTHHCGGRVLTQLCCGIGGIGGVY
jgi:hypothetical protein